MASRRASQDVDQCARHQFPVLAVNHVQHKAVRLEEHAEPPEPPVDRLIHFVAGSCTKERDSWESSSSNRSRPASACWVRRRSSVRVAQHISVPATTSNDQVSAVTVVAAGNDAKGP